MRAARCKPDLRGGVTPERQKLALTYGATDVVDFTLGDPVEQILEATGGEGVDAAIEAIGNPNTWEGCIRVTKPGGRISYDVRVPDGKPLGSVGGIINGPPLFRLL